jgi:2'-5' RNA ligase
MAARNERVKRLFIAVDLDARARAEVAAVTSALKRSVTSGSESSFVAAGFNRARVTWVPADRLHLTLAFLSEADASLEQRAMAALAERFPLAPFELAFDGVGFFPSTGSPRVMWLRITAGLAALQQLHDALERRLGARPGPREAFSPHLTLARFRDRVARADVAKLSDMTATAGPCRIDRVTLYESRLSPKGPTYTALAEAALIPILPCT